MNGTGLSFVVDWDGDHILGEERSMQDVDGNSDLESVWKQNVNEVIRFGEKTPEWKGCELIADEI